MPLPVLQEGEALLMQQAVESASTELDAILRRTCQLLAQMTRLPAVATPPDADDTELRQIFVTPAGADKALLVLLFSTGRTENRLLTGHLSASDALRLANALNERWGGAALVALRVSAVADAPPPDEIAALAPLWGRICAEMVAAARSVADDTAMVVEGTHSVLQLPEFRDVERLGQFLATLQERAALLEMLGCALPPVGTLPASRRAVAVTIGEEIGWPGMADYAVVSSPYYVGDRERGAIGVVGPTRMDYSRAAAAVGMMARTLSDLLTRLTVAP